MQNQQKIYKLIKIAILVFIVFFGMWLLNKNFDPLGKLTLSYNFHREKTPLLKFKNLSESEKNFSEKKWYRTAVASPIEINVSAPRPYKKIKIELEYQNPNYPIIYFAAQKKSKNYEGEMAQILENRIINDLAWYRQKNDDKDLVLLQNGEDKCERGAEHKESKKSKSSDAEKLAYEECQYKFSQDKSPSELLTTGNQEKKPWMDYKFENVDEFLKNISSVAEKEKIAAFNVDSMSYLKIDSTLPMGGVFDKTIRGEHNILTYIKNEPLEFTFFYQDLNRKTGKDNFDVNIKQNNNILAHYSTKGDDNATKNGKISEGKQFTIKNDGLIEGFYLLNLDITSDIVINRIETKQDIIAFKDGLNLFNAKQGIEFFTDAGNISFAPSHREALDQKILIEHVKSVRRSNESSTDENGEPTNAAEEPLKPPQILKIDKQKLYTKNLSGLNKISVQKNDIEIIFDGLAAFDLETLEKISFPNIKQLTEYNILNNPQSVDYIISTSAAPPKQINETWLKKEVEFDLADLVFDDKNEDKKLEYTFLLHIPGFDRNRTDIKFQKIKITFEKDPWNFGYLKNVIQARIK